ncbi:MAG TPA: DoxX family protein [Candidatus Limnocylindrales bacterium]|nr:DoxX family protein [Candidatus Limnocylindrales bacterium]
MDVVLWVAQVILGLAFFGAGFDQAVLYEDARRRMAWVAALPKGLAVTLGTLEMLGAVGLVVPAWTGIQRGLTATAALALAVLMGLAVIYHVSRREIPQIAFSATFGLLAAFVAFGRFVVAPF